ncbi:MAG: DAK2 domain-containing protein [Acidimicrobiales bacterium]
MDTPMALRPQEVRAALVAFRDVLRSHQQVLNRLNVYPVPDGDTGTNMALTLESVVQELAGLGDDADMSGVCRAMAHGSLMGARGNSGVILSQLLRGIAERIGPKAEAGPDDMAAALVTASELAQKAVVRPVEGTILTVARAAGDGATAGCEAGRELVAVVEQAREAAAEALAKTPTMLEALARAGVVDAGGSGYVLLFDALLSALDGRPLPAAPACDSGSGRPEGEPPATGSPVTDLRYEVMYLLDAGDDTIPAFKDVWAGVGDSIVVVGGDGLWNCHIHTDDIGAAIEAALDAGRPRQIRVTDLTEQVEEERWVRDSPAASGDESVATTPPPVTAVVAVVAGEGIGRILRSLGVLQLVTGGQSMNPSTEDLLRAVAAVPSDQVVLLPNNKNIRAVAAQVDSLTDKTVRVVPTCSIVEGFAALLDYDPDADGETNATAMAASAGRVTAAEVTRAVRNAQTEAGPVREGDWLGLGPAGIVAVAGTVAGAVLRLLEVLLAPGHELVTLIEGEGATPADTRRITEWVREERPGVAVEVHHGGQPLSPYLLGIE